VQYRTVQYSTVQYSIAQYSIVQHNTVQYNTVQYSTVQLKGAVFIMIKMEGTTGGWLVLVRFGAEYPKWILGSSGCAWTTAVG
jgi:hypothetical protein